MSKDPFQLDTPSYFREGVLLLRAMEVHIVRLTRGEIICLLLYKIVRLVSHVTKCHETYSNS